MKISAVIVSRNDNYGGRLNERATYCFNSAIETYDEVIYIDWNSPSHSLLYNIKDNVRFAGNFKHYVVDRDTASLLTNFNQNAQVCCEVLARNIGIRRAVGDWIVSTNIDIIHPKRLDLETQINKMDENTFYTISRRHTDWNTITDFHNGHTPFDKWQLLREHLIETSEERYFPEKTTNGDDYSLINCCGDYQIASKNIWNEIRGFEEQFIHSLYTDTNVQKKAVMHGFGLKAAYEPALFHIEHGRGGGGFLDGINRVTNDIQKAIVTQGKTKNLDSWGCVGIDIPFEVF